ncbi:hypothetical protein HanRHA438_Chr01g0031671 [Helianthus annuus]|nr:hypothetical protein HanRHA438_Chr01g0031671 [Helianthus annuus]
MRFFVVALLVVLAMAATSCLAIEHHQKTLLDETRHKIYQRKLKDSVDSTVNYHHYIPRQDYGKGGDSSIGASDQENHHHLSRDDWNNGGYTR